MAERHNTTQGAQQARAGKSPTAIGSLTASYSRRLVSARGWPGVGRGGAASTRPVVQAPAGNAGYRRGWQRVR